MTLKFNIILKTVEVDEKCHQWFISYCFNREKEKKLISYDADNNTVVTIIWSNVALIDVASANHTFTDPAM